MKKPTKTEMRANAVKLFIKNYGTMDYRTFKEWSSEEMDEATFNRLYKKHFNEVWKEKQPELDEKQLKAKLKLLSSCPPGWNVSSIRADYMAQVVGKLYNRFGMNDQALISYNGNNQVSYVKEYAKVVNKTNGEVEAKVFKVANPSGGAAHYVYATTEGAHIRKSTAFIKDAYAATAKLKRTFAIVYSEEVK